jgi:hypothetical protein
MERMLGIKQQKDGENNTSTASWLLVLNNYSSGRQIKKGEMGRACGTHGREEKKERPK